MDENTCNGVHTLGIILQAVAHDTYMTDTSYHPGGMILQFNNESAMTMETRSSRKRRADTDSDARKNNKENQPEVTNSESGSAQRTPKWARIIRPSSGQPEDVVPSESQLPTNPVPAPEQPCESAAGSVADDLACDLTLPPTAGQPMSIHVDDSSVSSPNCLDLLTDTTLVTFPTDAVNASGSNPFIDTAAFGISG